MDREFEMGWISHLTLQRSWKGSDALTIWAKCGSWTVQKWKAPVSHPYRLEEKEKKEEVRSPSPLLAAHLALGAAMPSSAWWQWPTVVFSLLPRTPHWRSEEPGGTLFHLPKTTFRIFFLWMLHEWGWNAFVSGKRMDHIVWTPNRHPLFPCEPRSPLSGGCISLLLTSPMSDALGLSAQTYPFTFLFLCNEWLLFISLWHLLLEVFRISCPIYEGQCYS